MRHMHITQLEHTAIFQDGFADSSGIYATHCTSGSSTPIQTASSANRSAHQDTMNHAITWNRHSVTKRFWGDVTSKDLIQSSKEISEDRHYLELHFVINDFSAIRSISVDHRLIENTILLHFCGHQANTQMSVGLILPTELGDQILSLFETFPFDGSYKLFQFDNIETARAYLAKINSAPSKFQHQYQAKKSSTGSMKESKIRHVKFKFARSLTPK